MTVGRGGVRVSLWVARALAVLATSLAATAVALPLVNGHGYLDELMRTPEVVVAVSFSVTGAVLVASEQARRMGWLLLAIGVMSGIYTVSLSLTAAVLRGDSDAALPQGSQWAQLTAWVSSWSWLPGYLLVVTVLPAVVPYGRSLGRVWRIPVALSVLTITLAVLVFAVSPGELGFFSEVDNPLGASVLADVLGPVDAVLQALVLLLIVLALVSLAVRVRRADAIERRQVGWFGYAVVLTLLASLFAPEFWVNGAVLAIPAGVAVAAFRYRLYDLDLLVNRTLVAGVLLGAAALGYVALVAWVGAAFGTSRGLTPFVAAFLVALAFHPARLLVQRWVDRLFFGLRGDPYALLRDLDRALRDASSPRAALSSAVEVVRAGLRLSGVTLTVPLPSGGTVQEQSGLLVGEELDVPLLLHGEEVGRLAVGARAAQGRLGSADARVVQSLAGPLASAAYALRLSGDLEDSRRRLVNAREDERRRLRRDLHDGLGPQLAGIVMGLDVIQSSLARGDAGRAGGLAADVGEQARSAVEDVRRLVAGLRPPVLDDLGLLGALRASGPAAAGGRPAVVFSTTGDLASLPAAVEVAAYRIVTEALTNAVRHADATTVEVTLDVLPEVLKVTVHDDGNGIAPGARSGVGLVSMRERAAELGGWCTAAPSRRGTRVLAELPVGTS